MQGWTKTNNSESAQLLWLCLTFDSVNMTCRRCAWDHTFMLVIYMVVFCAFFIPLVIYPKSGGLSSQCDVIKRLLRPAGMLHVYHIKCDKDRRPGQYSSPSPWPPEEKFCASLQLYPSNFYLLQSTKTSVQQAQLYLPQKAN
jgi:hypothetical protein